MTVGEDFGYLSSLAEWVGQGALQQQVCHHLRRLIVALKEFLMPAYQPRATALQVLPLFHLFCSMCIYAPFLWMYTCIFF